MSKRNMICICCPIGCPLDVEVNEAGEILSVSGNTCPRGKDYAVSELTHPTRVLTGSVRLSNREGMLSVKTEKPIPKEQIFEAMARVRSTSVEAPVKIGDIVIKDICDGIDLVATREVL